MALLLLELAAYPGEIAATKAGACRPAGAFFLDFSRPLGRQRYCGVWNRRIGVTLALTVPVVHQGQLRGDRVIAVDRADAYFGELQRLWQARHPAQRPPPAVPADAARVQADFAAQFPEDAREAAVATLRA